MKKILFITIIGLLLISCGKDNYDSPSSIIEGKITYQGETLGLRGQEKLLNCNYIKMVMIKRPCSCICRTRWLLSICVI